MKLWRLRYVKYFMSFLVFLPFVQFFSLRSAFFPRYVWSLNKHHSSHSLVSLSRYHSDEEMVPEEMLQSVINLLMGFVQKWRHLIKDPSTPTKTINLQGLSLAWRHFKTPTALPKRGTASEVAGCKSRKVRLEIIAQSKRKKGEKSFLSSWLP